MAVSVLRCQAISALFTGNLAKEVGKRRTSLADPAIGVHKERLAGMYLPNQDPQYQDRSPQAPHKIIMGKKSVSLMQ